jgi:hypothetical protein
MILTRLFLYVAILATRLYRALRSPLTWWESRVEARRAHERHLLELQLEAQAGMVKAMAGLMQGSLESVAQASAAQQDLFKTWLEGFKTTEVPVATTIRETDEIAAARERELDYLRANGVPVGLGPLDWVGEQVGPENVLQGLGIDVAALKQHLQ